MEIPPRHHPQQLPTFCSLRTATTLARLVKAPEATNRILDVSMVCSVRVRLSSGRVTFVPSNTFNKAWVGGGGGGRGQGRQVVIDIVILILT